MHVRRMLSRFMGSILTAIAKDSKAYQSDCVNVLEIESQLAANIGDLNDVYDIIR